MVATKRKKGPIADTEEVKRKEPKYITTKNIIKLESKEERKNRKSTKQ